MQRRGERSRAKSQVSREELQPGLTLIVGINACSRRSGPRDDSSQTARSVSLFVSAPRLASQPSLPAWTSTNASLMQAAFSFSPGSHPFLPPLNSSSIAQITARRGQRRLRRL